MTPTLDRTAAADLFRAPPHRHVRVDGGEVAVRTVGTGPDVLFVHGWPLSGATWHHLLPHLVDHVTCHVVDLPGGGDSRFDRDTDLAMQAHIARVPRVLDALALDDVALVGQDSGGMIARHVADVDDRVRSLGLIGTEIPGSISWVLRALLLQGRVPGFASVLVRLHRLRRLRGLPFAFGGLFHDQDRVDGVFREFVVDPLGRDADRRWAATQGVRRFDTDLVHALADIHARLDVPVALVWGEQDPFFPVAAARAMAATIDEATFTVVPEAKLFVHEERPAAVAEALLPAIVP